MEGHTPIPRISPPARLREEQATLPGNSLQHPRLVAHPAVHGYAPTPANDCTRPCRGKNQERMNSS